MDEIELPKVYHDPNLPPGQVVIAPRRRHGWYPDIDEHGEEVMVMSIPDYEMDVSGMEELDPSCLGLFRERIETLWSEIKAQGFGPVTDYVCLVNLGEADETSGL